MDRGGFFMEKEQVIEKLEEVFVKACDRYKVHGGTSLSEIRELGETIIRNKQSMRSDVQKAERYIDERIEKHIRCKNEIQVSVGSVEVDGQRHTKVLGISEKSSEVSE